MDVPQRLNEEGEHAVLVVRSGRENVGLIVDDFHGTSDIILKPLDGMGGMGIFRVKADGLNLGGIIETLNRDGAQTVMVQKFIPAIEQGDKRVLLINGVPVPFCLARIPQGGEVRGNLAAGGKGVARELTARDREIAAFYREAMVGASEPVPAGEIVRGSFVAGRDFADAEDEAAAVEVGSRWQPNSAP